MKKLLLSCFLLFTAALSFAQAPNISYPASQSYVLGKTITNLTPSNTGGGAVPNIAYSRVTTLAGGNIATGFVNATGTAARFKNPYYVASDAAGNIYVSDTGNDVIRKVTPAGVVTTFLTGLSDPGGLAFDADGNLYIADTGNQLIKKVTPAGVVSVYAGSGGYGSANGPALDATFRNPQDVAVDAAGNLYIADYNNHVIRKVSAAGIVSNLAGIVLAPAYANGPGATARFRNPQGIDVDAAGNVYVADFGNNAIRKIAPDGTVTTIAGNGTAGFAEGTGTSAIFYRPGDVAVDKFGNVYVSDTYNGLIRIIAPNGVVSTFAGKNGYIGRTDGIGTDAVFGFPEGITLAPNGDLYTADYTYNGVRRVFTKGYFIDKPLPPGLVFDPTTGIISGKPTAVTPADDYTVYAYNDDGSSKFTINIEVRLPSEDATLSSLTVSAGALTPVFSPTTKRYVINVPTGTTSTTVTPTLSDTRASLTLNGALHPSGTTSASIPLVIGNNNIIMRVTSESDTTISNYVVSVVQAKPAIAPPVVTYPGTRIYSVNVPIPNLVPTVKSGSVPANEYGRVTTIATGLDRPVGITADPAGNVYVADASKQIRKITPSGSMSVFVGLTADLKSVTGLSSDAQGNIYAADAGDNKIRIISPAGAVDILSGHSGDFDYVDGVDTTARFATPSGVGTDGASNVYIADQDNNLIRKRTLDGIVSTFAGTRALGSNNGPGASATFSKPVALASDFNGNLYVADQANNLIRKITPTGEVSTFAGNGTAGRANGVGTAASFDTPAATAVESNGMVYVADAGNSRIRKITPTGTVAYMVGNGQYGYADAVDKYASFNYPLGIAVDNDGHLFVADYGNNAVRKVETTGYSINPYDNLPAGLTFDSRTGIISGTPTAITPRRVFTITAYNLGGISTSTVQITVNAISNEARLSNIQLNHGALSPVFGSDTYTYSASVSSSSITITPTPMHVQATIKVNNVTVAGGAESAPVPLALGANPIEIVVTAPDGVATKTYTLNVTRTAAAPNANLSGLTLSAGTLSPAFAAGTTAYNVTVGNTTSNFTITPSSANSLATITVNNTTVASGAASAAIPLNFGNNPIEVVVTDENGNSKKYTVTVKRDLSADAGLAALGVSEGSLFPAFNTATQSYRNDVDNSVTGITVTPTTNDVNATIKVNNVVVADGMPSGNIPLIVGDNPIAIEVTAQNGLVTKTYTLTVRRAPSANNNLSGLSLSSGVLAQPFSAATLQYDVSVPSTVTSLQVTATAEDAGALIQVNGVTTAGGSPSAAIPLVTGINPITVKVTAPDGSAFKTYTIDVVKAASTNSNLSALALSSGAFLPVFNPATLSYNATVANAVTSVTITPTVADAGATVQVNTVPVASGAASGAIALNVGVNTIDVNVTAEDGTSATAYQVKVTRTGSNDASLSGLSISAGFLSPAFTPGTILYNASVPNSVTGIKITPTAGQANAVISINGVTIASGTASATLPLAVGDNVLKVNILAEDGVTTATYTVNVKRLGSTISTLSSLVASAGVLTPSFAPSTLSYSFSVTSAVSTTTITPTATDATASIKVNNVVVASGAASAPIPLNIGANTINVDVVSEDGTSTSPYKITVDRVASTNASLSGLTLSAGIIGPFSPGTLTYNTTVSNATTSLTVMPTAADSKATIKVNNAVVASGAASAPIALNVGSNTINVEVTAEDGSTQLSYQVQVTREASNDATLSGLTASAGSFVPAFSSAITTYDITVPNGTGNITFTPTPNQANATINVNGNAVAAGAASQSIPLVVGSNPVNIDVKAEDGTLKQYAITVHRLQSGNNLLSSLVPGTGSLSPAFASSTNNYEIVVANAVTSITFRPTVADATATVTVNSTVVSSGAVSSALPLSVGDNEVRVIVTAENSNDNTYVINVKRGRSADATLSSLTLNGATLSPAFASATFTGYSATVANTVTGITLTPTLNQPDATIEVDGTAVASGAASQNIPLALGNNLIKIKVTAQDGLSIHTYEVTVTRALSNDATLSALTISSGSLSPNFTPANTGYEVHVANSVASVTLTPTVNQPNATVKVNNVTIPSGTASSAIPLIVGSNVITVHVNAQDNTPKDYTVTVIKAPPVASSDAGLASLAVSTGTLSPSFTQARLTYDVSVPNSTTSIRVTAASTDANAFITIGGATVASGTPSAPINLNGGDNFINVLVTAEDGTPGQTYTIKVTRALSTDATLSNLTVSAGALDPVFSPSATGYNVAVGNAITTIRITPTVNEPNATVKVNNVTVASGSASGPQALLVGPNTITVVVTPQSGPTKTYTLTVTRAKSSNANLANLTLNAGALTPPFAAGTQAYTVTVSNAITSIRLTPTVADATATVKVNTATVASGSASAAISLVVGDNPIPVEVTAADGITKGYTVTVTREKSVNADLANMVPSTGALVPGFAAATLSYKIDVANTTTSIKITPTVADATATVEVNHLTVASGAASADIPLLVGTNTVEIKVTAQNTAITKSYFVVVERAKSPNANLAGLSISSGTFDVPFAANTVNYKVTVPNTVKEVSVTAQVAEPNATLQINGAAVASGSPSANIPLPVGDKIIEVKVTAQDNTTKSYFITVTRLRSPDATLSNLVFSAGALTPAFSPSVTSGYRMEVGNDVKTVTVTPTANEPNATIKVNNVTVVSGNASAAIALLVGDNTITVDVVAQDGTPNKYTVVIKRAPSSNAFLSALGVSSGTYTPNFDKNAPEFGMFVGNNVTNMVITPVLEDNTATITVAGAPVANGAASAPIPLNTGNNTILTRVLAQDGVSKKEYLLRINRAESSENDLSNLTISAGTFDQPFQPGVTRYNVRVNFAVSTLTVTPTVADPTATVTVNGIANASGAISAPINLTVGSNTITVLVKAQNGQLNPYTITVIREGSANANLAGLTANTGALTPAFASATLDYQGAQIVDYTVNTVKITPTVDDINATVRVNGITVASGSASPDIPLNVGVNKIPVVVTSQSGTAKNYSVSITRAQSKNADLAGITISGGTLDPVFTAGQTEYTVTLGNATTGITVTPTTSDAAATVTVNGNPVTPGNNSGNIPLAVGDNTITIRVVAPDGTPKEYLIKATREASGNNNLANLVPGAGSLDPAFAQAMQAYTLSVLNNVDKIRFTPTVADATATVTINGTPVNSGSASAEIQLQVGIPTGVLVVVTAQNSVPKEYKVTVTRQKSANNNLANLVSNAGSFTSTFDPAVLQYIINVPNTTTSATLTATAEDPTATIEILGRQLASGAESDATQLGIGNNTIEVLVTAENTTSKRYVVTINRAASANNSLSGLTVSAGTLSPVFDPATLDYKVTLPYAEGRIRVTPTAGDATATITVNGVAVTSGTASGYIDLAVGVNSVEIIVTAANGDRLRYDVEVTREVRPPSTDASLASLFLTQGELTPAFSRNTFTYNATVTSDVTKTNVVAIVSDPHATITVNGATVESGKSSGDILLVDGANIILVRVTAEDGVTAQPYRIVVTRANFAAKLPNVFTPNGDGYNDTWVLPNINLYPDCTVKIFNRGGQQVFNSVGYGTPWDGTWNGKQLDPGTYYYIIDLKHGQGIRSGAITIIR